MLRLHPKLIRKLLSTYSRNGNNTRNFSSKSSGKFKISLLLGSGVVAVTTLTLAYANYDKQFADQIIAYAPFMKNLFEENKTDLKVVDEFRFPKRKIEKQVEVNKIDINLEQNLNEEKILKEKDTANVNVNTKLPEPEKESKPKKELDENKIKLEVEKNIEQKKDDKQEFEDLFREQLKRLLYVFNEFYEEKRILYENESKQKHEIELKNHLLQERKAITKEYDKSFKKLKQMEKLLQIRDQLDKQEKASKKLWILSQTLSKLLEHNRSISKEIVPIDIYEKINCIREVVKESFSNETLIQVALNSLSENAIKNGVYSEEDLIRRFHKIHKICNRVALVPNDYTTIYGYLKSYAYSYIRPFFQIDIDFSLNPIKLRKIPQEELEGKLEVDPKEWDVYDILQRVNLCIEHRNLEMALRYANLLTGEPYRVARDWIMDTKEHLEVKQVLELVQTKISSINLHQLSFRCGGFVISSVSINFQPIKVKLYTDRGIIKYSSDCAPNNGYYFIPLYDFGKYVLRIKPPNGWIFEPTEVEFNFDGKNDLCSKQVDINFIFKGFTIFGKVFSLNSSSGSKGVQITLLSKRNNNIIKQNITAENGLYEFHEVLPGQYVIEATHEKWKFINNRVIVNVVDDNINHQQVEDNCSDQLCLLGYSAIGKVVSDGRPIRRVQFALFGSNKPSSDLGCIKTKPNYLSKLEIDQNYHYWCHTSSNEHGLFKFDSLPNGIYMIYSYYETQNIRFEVKPYHYKFEIAQDDLDMGIVFEIGGFSVFGQVLNLLNFEDEIQNAHVKLIDENNHYGTIEMFVKEPKGKFTINNIKTSNYLIRTSAEQYQFDDIKFLISPNSPNLPIISPSKYQICVRIIFKNFEFKYENIELLIIEKYSKTLKESFIMESDNFCFFLSGGEYLLQMNTKYSNLKFIPNTLELQVNKPQIDIVFEQMTVTLNGNIKLKSYTIKEADFLSVIFSNSKSILKTLQFDELTPKSENEYEFILDNLLPGEYLVAMGGKQMDYFCWYESVIPINVNQNETSNVWFKQKGFLLQITLSHASDLIIKSPNGIKKEITLDSISQKRLVKYCAEEIGKYIIEPIGCHKFFLGKNSSIIFDTQTMAGQMISLTALQHLVTAKIKTNTNITDLQVMINLKSNEGEKNFTIPIKNCRMSQADIFEYDLEFYENSMSDIHIEPRSSELIFKPSYFRFQLKDDCYPDVVTFYGRPGIFINGRISQNIPDVKIIIYDNETNQILHQTATDQEGKYQAGPFDDEISLKIEALKEDFVFKPIPEKKGFFEVSKLSSVTTIIVDENGNSLNEVLISLSGGENNFRRNSFVNSDGKLLFDNLHSGQYFIRFLRKEYDFQPSSKMLDLQNGDNIVIKVVGKKVAFSCIGIVDSLNGEPEPGIIVEASGIKNIFENSSIQCSQLQEQSTSEMDGSFRILGLLPDCEYLIRLKTELLKSRNISKSIPQFHSVHVQNDDLTDLRFIVIYKSFQMDLTVSIQVDEEYLSSILIKLFHENDPNVLLYKQTTLSSPFVFLPSILLDNRTYVLYLDSNLDTKLYQYQPIVYTFQANRNYIHLDFDFKIQKRLPQNGLNEQEITNNSIYSIILFLIGFAIYNHKYVNEFCQKLPFNSNSFIGNFMRQKYTNNHNSSENPTSKDNNKKKVKSKKN